MSFDKFIVVDDFIPLSLQEEIKGNLIGKSEGHGFPWFYTNDITYGVHAKNSERNPAFSHLFKVGDKVVSPHFSFVAGLAHIGAGLVDFNFKSIIQARAFIQLPLESSFKRAETDLLHIDSIDPHLVVLYYVVDADGDTLLTDTKYTPGEEDRWDMKVEDHNVIARVTPKQGRALIFDGSYYHTAEQPTNSLRCVINFDVA